jgi:purine-nucleoside phosphorylase
VISPAPFRRHDNHAMIHEDAIVRPVRSPRSPFLGPVVLLAAAKPDVGRLREGLDLPDSYPLYMSRIYYNAADPNQPAVVGPIMGAPYAVMLLEVLRSFGGVQRGFFIGWCGSIDPRVRIGDLIVPTGAWIDEGTSVHYGQSFRAAAMANQELQEVLRLESQRRRTTCHNGLVWTTDAIFRETRTQINRYQRLGALAVEMELSALLSAASFYDFPLAALLAVSDELFTYHWQPGFKTEAFRQACQTACELLINLSKNGA